MHVTSPTVRRSARARGKARSRLCVEPLEPRANPVTAFLNGSTLVINGDDLVDDVIAVRQTVINTVEVYDGRMSTMVPAFVFNRAVVTAIQADGLGGNDLIDL